jgi:hypothetical protein
MTTGPQLGTYLAELRWSPERLARELNREYGQGTVSPKAPYGWLKGSFPRGRIPGFVADVLSDRLGKPVEIGQIWPGRADGGTAADDHLERAWSIEAATRSLRRLAAPRRLPAEPAAPHPGTALLSVAVDWLTATRQPVPAGREPNGFFRELPDVLAERLDQLRRMDDRHGGLPVADWCVYDLRWVVKLLDEGSHDASTGRQLYLVAAELAQVGGWLLADLGRYGEGQRHQLAALRAAAVAGDREFGAYVLSCLAYYLTWRGRPRDAVRVLTVARQGVESSPMHELHALLATRLARGHAGIGDDAACEAALAEAAEQLDKAGPVAARPAWIRWLTPALLAADAGRAQLELGRPRRAEPLLSTGLAQLDETQRRNRLLHSLSLAEACLAVGELEGAAQAALAALPDVAAVDSGRARQRLRLLRQSFARHDTVLARQTVDRFDEVASRRAHRTPPTE